MSSLNGRRDDSEGCLIIAAIVAASIGVGFIWGAGMGWLVLGAILLSIAVIGS